MNLLALVLPLGFCFNIVWDAKWLLLKIFAVVNCREGLWIQNQPMVGNKDQWDMVWQKWREFLQMEDFPWKAAHCYLFIPICLPGRFEIVLGMYSVFTFFSVYRFLLFLCPLPPSPMFVFELKLDTVGERSGFLPPLPLWSLISYLCL